MSNGRNSIMKSLLLVVVVGATWASQSGTTRTVSKSAAHREKKGHHLYVSTSGSDRNTCTSSAPCRTISRASQVAVPGTTIHVAPGAYAGDFVTAASGTASSRITYISDTKWGAKLIGSGSGVLWQLDASYVDVIGFDISGPNATGIFIGWSRLGTVGYNRLLHNYVHDLTVRGGCNSTGGAALATGQATGLGNNQIIGNRVANIGASMIGRCFTVQGIYISNANNLVENNIVSGVADVGITQEHGGTASTIVNNTVFNCWMGIAVGNTSSPNIASSNNYVANNISVHNQGGFQEFNVGSGNQYVDNLVYGNRQYGNFYKWKSAAPIGTVTADPQFVNYKADGSGDYHLNVRSPAIDKGTASRAPNRDHDGGARPMGAGWDIGAYEAGATPAMWPWVGNISEPKTSTENAPRRHPSKP